MRDTIDMAHKAGIDDPESDWMFWNAMERFEALVRADAIAGEREACAKVCEQESKDLGGVAEGPFVTDFGKHTHMSMAAGAENCAAAIRSRSSEH